MLAAVVVALIWSNSHWASSYDQFIHTSTGVLGMDLQTFAADGLLAVFFMVVGIELKHELTYGSLREPRAAAVPVAAALTGMACAAAIFLARNAQSSDSHAWAIPISTDAALALGVLAVAGRRLPVELRAFLLTVAVVNDLGAVLVVALFYGSTLSMNWLAVAITVAALFGLLQRAHRLPPHVRLFAELALAALCWYAMTRSGVHPALTGVLLGAVMRVDDEMSRGRQHAERLRPWATLLCVPIFALTSAGVAMVNPDTVFSAPLGQGVIAGLVIGQPLGIVIGARVAMLLTHTALPRVMTWWDVAIAGLLAGVGFTVALLVTTVVYANGSTSSALAKSAVLMSNVIAVALVVTAVALRTRFVGTYRHSQ